MTTKQKPSEKGKEKEIVEGEELTIITPSNLSVSLSSVSMEMDDLIKRGLSIIKELEGKGKDKPAYT